MRKKFLSLVFPVKGDSKGEIARKLTIIVSFIVLVVCIVLISSYYINSYLNDRRYKQLKSIYNSASNLTNSSSNDSKYPAGMLPNFTPLYDMNSDIKGWIIIPSTVINYPVVETSDNSYYLSKGFNETKDNHGTLFLDYRDNINPMSQNLIIYGHEMRDGQMFHSIRNYAKVDFYNSSPIITFNTLYSNEKWEVFAAFIANTVPSQGYVFNYLITNFSSSNDFTSFINEVKARSLIKTSVDVNPGDTLLTLSTCTYELPEARFVVMARRVRKGEALDVDKAAINKNHLDPTKPIK
jgi:sortase B